MEDNPGRFIPEKYRKEEKDGAVTIDLNKPMKEILTELSKHPVGTRLSLNGTIIVGRDIAHAKLKERIDKGEDLPQYIQRPSDLLCWSGKNTQGETFRIVRANYGRKNGPIR